MTAFIDFPVKILLNDTEQLVWMVFCYSRLYELKTRSKWDVRIFVAFLKLK